MIQDIQVRPTLNAGTVDWSKGPLLVGEVLDSAHDTFPAGAGGQKVVVEVDGDAAKLQQNTPGGLRVNFGTGDFVLETSKATDRLILTFDPPVSAAAIQMAAISNPFPGHFTGVAEAFLDDGTEPPEIRTAGTTTGVRDGKAICVGFECSPGDSPIASIALSIETSEQNIIALAVNQLTFVSAAAAVAAPLVAAAPVKAVAAPVKKAAKTKKARG